MQLMWNRRSQKKWSEKNNASKLPTNFKTEATQFYLSSSSTAMKATSQRENLYSFSVFWGSCELNFGYLNSTFSCLFFEKKHRAKMKTPKLHINLSKKKESFELCYRVYRDLSWVRTFLSLSAFFVFTCELFVLMSADLSRVWAGNENGFYLSCEDCQVCTFKIGFFLSLHSDNAFCYCWLGMQFRFWFS